MDTLFNKFNYEAFAFDRADGSLGVMVCAPDDRSALKLSASSIVAMMVACLQIEAACEPTKDGRGLAIDGALITRAMRAAFGAMELVKAENGGWEHVESTCEHAVGKINEALSEYAAEHPTRRDDDNSRPPNEAKADLALARDLGMDLTADPVNGGPGGTMGDAAASLPVPGKLVPIPGMTRGNELHSKPVMRLWTPGDN